MSCLCTVKAGALTDSLLPMFPLTLTLPPIPKFMKDLAMTPGGASPAAGAGGAALSAGIKAQLGALLALNPPALAVDAAMLAQLQAILPTLAHVKATLGIDLRAPGAAAALGPIMAQADLALPSLAPLAALEAAPLIALSGVLSLMASLQSSLGINLLKPGIKVQLQAALSAAPPFPAAALAPFAPYGVLAGAMAGFGVRDAAQLSLAVGSLPKLPALKLDLAVTAKISGLLLALSTCTKALGFSPLAPNASARIALMLAPLTELETVVLSAGFAAAAQAATLLRMVMPLLKVNLGTMKLALPKLALPDLSAAASVGSILADGGLGSLSACGPACGMAASLPPAGMGARLSSIFGR